MGQRQKELTIPTLEEFPPEILQGYAETCIVPADQLYKGSGSHHCLLQLLLYIQVEEMCGLV